MSLIRGITIGHSRAILGILLVAAAFAVLSSPQRVEGGGLTYVVDTAIDYDAMGCGLDPNDCSLRGAIGRANGSPGLDTIVFDFDPPETQVTEGKLTPITEAVTINGDLGGGQKAQLRGLPGAPAPGYAGIEIWPTAAGVTIMNMVIMNMPGIGIEISPGSYGNVITNNYIGVDGGGTIGAGNDTDGIHISGHSNTVTSNVISGNDDDGIELAGAGATGNVVTSNIIGLNKLAMGAVPNGDDGVRLSGGASNNTIGTNGTTNFIAGNTGDGVSISNGSNDNDVDYNYIGVKTVGGEGVVANGGNGVGISGDDNHINYNLISGNTGYGVFSDSNANRTRIEHNKIGTDSTGELDRGNGQSGVRIDGGPSRVYQNVISGNGDFGVLITGASATNADVFGNMIGVDDDGQQIIGNSNDGVGVSGGASSNRIGGTDAGNGNVISGNGDNGVIISQTTTHDNLVQANSIGMNITGTVDLGNVANGVHITDSVDNIVGATSGPTQIIGGNGGVGVRIRGTGSNGNIVQGNSIGTTAGNSSHGVWVSSLNSRIGGTGPGAGNAIVNNGGDGVFVDLDRANSIYANSIYNNAGLGIDIEPNGVNSPNDDLDGDAGANDLMNFPVVASATTGSIHLIGSLNSQASQNYTIEFYYSPACDSSLAGEGKTYIGRIPVTSNAQGNVSYDKTYTVAVPPGSYITATATNGSGNGSTSEFSPCVTLTGEPVETPVNTPSTPVVTPPTPGVTTTVTPGTGTPSTVTPTATVTPHETPGATTPGTSQTPVVTVTVTPRETPGATTPGTSETPVVTPTATVTPGPTTTPHSTATVTPASSGQPGGKMWGNVDCDDELSTRDNQALLRKVLSQAALSQREPCPDLGVAVKIDELDEAIWGDQDCDGEITTRDNQLTLRYVLNQPPLTQTQPCPPMGTEVPGTEL